MFVNRHKIDVSRQSAADEASTTNITAAADGLNTYNVPDPVTYKHLSTWLAPTTQAHSTWPSLHG